VQLILESHHVTGVQVYFEEEISTCYWISSKSWSFYCTCPFNSEVRQWDAWWHNQKFLC